MHRSASPFSRHPSLPRPAAGPCFRTDAEGRIPLTRDWLALFSGARRFNRLVLQTRHRHARLLALGPLPALSWDPARGLATDEAGDLLLRLPRWRHAWGRLGHCPCCGSPGRVEIHDARGREFLQLCAHSEDSPADWAAYLAAVAAPLNAVPPAPVSPAPGDLFVRLPADARPLTDDATALHALLAALAEEQTPFSCTLATPATTHTRELTPRRIRCEDGLLTVGDGETTLQAALGSAQGLAVRRVQLRTDLHLVGPNRTSLLTLRPAADPAAAFLWAAGLRAVFPCLG